MESATSPTPPSTVNALNICKLYNTLARNMAQIINLSRKNCVKVVTLCGTRYGLCVLLILFTFVFSLNMFISNSVDLNKHVKYPISSPTQSKVGYKRKEEVKYPISPPAQSKVRYKRKEEVKYPISSPTQSKVGYKRKEEVKYPISSPTQSKVRYKRKEEVKYPISSPTQSKVGYTIEEIKRKHERKREEQVATTCNCTDHYHGNNTDTKSYSEVTRNNVSGTNCMKKQYPKAILIGMTKGGTTGLMQFLMAHPLVVPLYHKTVKDTRYFCRYYRKSYDWYRNLMPCSYPHQITISKSTSYFYTPKVAGRIRKFDPLMKIVIIIREPIERALSHYAMWKHQAEYRIGNKSFEDAVTSGSKKEIDENCSLIRVSDYQRHMKAWLDNFSLNQILILDGHNFLKHPAEELNKLEDFLGVERYFTQDSFIYNEAKRKYCLATRAGSMECLADKKGLPHPHLEKGLRVKLEKFFRPRNEMLFKMINRSFDWGY